MDVDDASESIVEFEEEQSAIGSLTISGRKR